MAYPRSRRYTIVLLVVFCLFGSTACQTFVRGFPKVTQTPDTAGSVASSPASEVAAVQMEVDFGPGNFNFTDTKSGLADQISYKATLNLSFDGTHDEKTERWTKTYVMMTTKEPAARQLTIEKTGDFPDLDAVFMVELDGAAYERLGKKACTVTVIESENSLSGRMEPVGFLIGVVGAEKAGSETVNGIPADHYTFDERALGQLDVTKSQGEMWVASTGGYIVKYVLKIIGSSDYFGEGIEGTLSLNYDLTDVNQQVAIQLPEDCSAGIVNAPLLPDATNILRLPGVLAFDSSTSIEDTAAFYQKQLPDLGWKLVGEPAMTEASAFLDFTQGDSSMTVIIIKVEEVSTVRFILTP